jgi:fluoride exporter
MADHARQSFLAPLAAVACGGAIGTTLRHVFSATFPADPGAFAWATFTENVVGSFLLGYAIVAILERMPPTRHLQPFLCTGVLGSFTTFSNYSVEIVSMLENGRPGIGIVYALASIVVSLLAAITGMTVSRMHGGRP